MQLLIRLLVVVLIGSYLCMNLYDSEFYWHLMMGQWILANRELPTVNLWTTSGFGQSWFNQHWLFQVVLAVVENTLGEYGLLTAKLAMICIIVALLAWSLSKKAGDVFLGMLVAVLLSCGLLSTTPFEPQLLAWAGLVVLLVLMDSKDQTLWTRAVLLLNSVVWGNIYPSVVVVVLVISTALFCLNNPRDFKPAFTRYYLPNLCILLLGQLLNPSFGLQILEAIWELKAGFLREVFFSTHPTTIYNFTSGFLILILVLILLLWHSIILSGEKRAATVFGRGELAVWILVVLCGFRSAVVTPYALAYSGLVLATIWQRGGSSKGSLEFGSRGNIGEAISQLQSVFARAPKAGLIWVMLCASFVNVAKLLRAPSSRIVVPGVELDFILDRRLQPPVVHESSIGGYLAYRYSTLTKSLESTYYLALCAPEIISNSEQHCQYDSLISLSSGWKEQFDSLEPKTVLVRYDSPLYSFLNKNPDWQLVFLNGRPWPVPDESGPEGKKRTANSYSFAIFVRNQVGIGIGQT